MKGRSLPTVPFLLNAGAVDRKHRRGLGHAVALEQAQAEFLHVDAARLGLQGLGAGDDVAQRAEARRRRRCARRPARNVSVPISTVAPALSMSSGIWR